jgi:CheY-like chemotaxis protein
MPYIHEFGPANERRSQPRKRALIVDDDVLSRIETRLLLELNGYQVEEVSDGMEAIGLLDVDAPRLDLVVLDSEMTLLDGLETLYSLRALQPGLKAMICLAKEQAVRVDNLPEGAVFLRKPCTMLSLSEGLDQLFGTHRHILGHGRLSQSHKVKLSGHRPHYPPR